MEIDLKRENNAVHFRATNPLGNSVDIDGSEAIGGENKGMRPMELLLTSVASCGVFDTLQILKKQRQPVEDIAIKIKGERAKDTTPTPFTSIHIHFIFTGDLDGAKVDRAVSLSVEKYCSAAASLDPNISITHDFEINTPSSK